MPKKTNKPELTSAEAVELFMRKHWEEHQKTSNSEKQITFVQYILIHGFLLKHTGWYWDANNFMFRKI